MAGGIRGVGGSPTTAETIKMKNYIRKNLATLVRVYCILDR